MSVQHDSNAHSPPVPTRVAEKTLVEYGSDDPSLLTKRDTLGVEGPPNPDHNNPVLPNHDMAKTRMPAKSFFHYELPKAIASVRDGRQLSTLSGTIISALFTVVALAFRSFIAGNQQFQDDQPFLYQVMVTICYISIFLNINATFGSFLLLHDLGEMGYEAAKLSTTGRLKQLEVFGPDHGGINRSLKDFGSNRLWSIMVFHWMLTFYFGIVTLIMALLAYIILTESLGTIALMMLVVAFTFVPTSLFMLFGGFTKQKPIFLPPNP